MTSTLWSARGAVPGGGSEFSVSALWDKERGYVAEVHWLPNAASFWQTIRRLGPYADGAAAVRAAKRQRRRLERDEGAAFGEPRVPAGAGDGRA